VSGRYDDPLKDVTYAVFREGMKKTLGSERRQSKHAGWTKSSGTGVLACGGLTSIHFVL
jgi:hypothetical protein